MRKRFMVSVALATLLFGFASADSVAQKEAQALNNPTITFGDKAAKAQIQEAQSKLYFQSKLDAQKFQKEALNDEQKRINYSVSKEAQYQNAHFKMGPKEVMEGLTQTLQAIAALQKNDIKTAKELLAKASENFQKALKANPNLSFVPIAQEIVVKVFQGDVKLIKTIIQKSIELLKNNDTQAARALLIPLQDEMDIITEYLPMKLYPLATKEAAKALDKGNVAKALAILSAGLNTIVVTQVVIPIPLLVAQDLVIAASKLDKSKKKEALALLEAAKAELEKAVLLGYAKPYSKEYQNLKKEIEAIEKEIKGKNEVEKLYEHILNSFSKLLDEIRGDKEAKLQVTKYQQEQLKKAIELKDVFEKQAKEAMQKAQQK